MVLIQMHLKSPEQVKNVLSILIDSKHVDQVIPADSAEGREITEN